MRAVPNYVESCPCGDPLENVSESVLGRIITWMCPTCGRRLASTMASDSPVTGCYVLKTLFTRTNDTCREAKGLPAKPTRVLFYDKDGKRKLWKDIEAENRRWEKRQGYVNRKPF